MPENPVTYEIYGIRHATNASRKRGQNYILEAHPEDIQAMDFYSWVLVGGGQTIVVDTGMDPVKAAQSGHTHLLSPVDALRKLGTEPEAVDTVILTHAHYDHLGFIGSYPNALFHMQAEEMDYVTGPWMGKHWFRHAYKADEIASLVHLLHNDRLDLHGRDKVISDGVSVHWVGGHCAGQEIVRVRTARGWVVLASDALHYYEEYERGVPFAIAFNLSDMIAAHDRIAELADSDDHILPAHDPRIIEIYPKVDGVNLENVLRLDVSPKKL